jgi:hypothetical protein
MVAHGPHRDDNILIADLAWKKRDRQTNLINEGRGISKWLGFVLFIFRRERNQRKTWLG